jgi:hypothetical protein
MCEEREVFVLVHGFGYSPVFILVAETAEQAKELATREGQWVRVNSKEERNGEWAVLRQKVWA